MATEDKKTQSYNLEFERFWSNFRAFPWRWVEVLTNHSRYLLLTVAFVYAILAILTFFPENKWMAPKHISYLEEIQGYDQVLFLKSYPSINFLIIGFGVSVMLVIRWRHEIPFIFQWLWESERLRSKDDALKKEFITFLQDYQSKLLSKKGGIILGSVLVGMQIGLLLYAGAFRFIYFTYTPMGAYAIYVCLAIMLFWVFLIGQIIWLIAVTSNAISDLTKKFTIRIQPSHPDKCGGLKPLGDFWLDAAMPIVFGGLILALVSILNLDLLDEVISFITMILIFVLIAPLTVLAVFVPLWSIHRAMIHEKKAYQDAYAQQSRSLEREIQTHTGENGDLSRAKIAKEKLEILHTIHPDKLTYPVWPFWFTPTILGVFSPQILITIFEVLSVIYGIFFK